MTSIVLPALITHSWRYGSLSSAGMLNAVPDASTGTFTASFQDGLPLITATAEGAGGTPTPQGDMNGILQIITGFQLWVNAGGQFPFSATLSTAIGGYPLGAVVQLSTGTSSVISTVNGNTNNPNTNMAGWAPYGGSTMATLTAVVAAQNTANSAVTAAASAQTTANTAITTANAAQSSATTALAKANYAVAKQKITAINIFTSGSSWTVAYNASRMSGLCAGAAPIIPQSTGIYLVILTGNIVSGTVNSTPIGSTPVGGSTQIGLCAGLGNGPGNGTAESGTPVGGAGVVAGGAGTEFTLVTTVNLFASIGGSGIGVPCWIDAFAFALLSGQISVLSNISLQATEIG
jgi:hypothetical protein